MLAEGPIDLAEANLLIAAEATRGLDMDSCLLHVEALADLARRDGVAQTLRDQGFRGDDLTYDDPRNSFLNEVLERRRGLPIALATLTLAVADRAGHPMAGIGMPGHFVVADLSGPEPAFLDPFDRWRELTVADCARLVERTSGLPFRAEFLAPVPPRGILARTLANLRGSYLRRLRPLDALWTVEVGLIVTPGDLALTRRSVPLLAAAGRYDDAEAVAEGLRADTLPGPARDDLEAQIAAIRTLRSRLN
jgi:regulator of sirC expression with transglutaminase-like and TPR domain